MAETGDYRYAELIDQLAGELRPVKRLWPVRKSLGLWVALETAILLLAAVMMGRAGFSASMYGINAAPIATLLAASVAAAGLALRGAVPGREASRGELALLALAITVAGAGVDFGGQADAITLPILSRAGGNSILSVLGWAALPCIALFIAVGRGVALHPARTGGLIGIASFCFAIAADRFVSRWSGAPCPEAWSLVLGLVVTTLAAWVGSAWFNPSRMWRIGTGASETAPSPSTWWGVNVGYSLALAASIAMLVVTLQAASDNFAPVRNFDLAIAGYEQSLTSFRSNVPSSSIDTVLAAYVEHGMPSYMWDFGPEGFKLVGGRLDQLPDGTLVSYTWFRKQNTGVMCMFKATVGFNPPTLAHDRRGGMLFYRYRGFSICLLNLGNYGNFISVIVAPMPMIEFQRMVLASAR
jgi:hypothetical protein